MVRKRIVLAILVVGVGLGTLASACTGSDTTTTASTPAAAIATTPTAAPTKGTKSPRPTATSKPIEIPRTFSPKNFETSLTDVNALMPLTPGLQSVSKGFVYVGGRRLPHVRVTTVTDVTKTIDGVRAVAVLDQDYDGGNLSEQSIDYLAEDVGGNIWYVGSYTEAYEGGQFVNAQDAWLADVNGAAPGLWLPGDPKTGAPPFYQVQIPGGEQSTAVVVETGRKTCVPFRCFTDVVVIQEQGSENKHWAPGAGAILTEPLSGSAQETEELVNLTELSDKALAELSAEALKMDRSAAVHASYVFAGSAAAKRNEA